VSRSARLQIRLAIGYPKPIGTSSTCVDQLRLNRLQRTTQGRCPHQFIHLARMLLNEPPRCSPRKALPLLVLCCIQSPWFCPAHRDCSACRFSLGRWVHHFVVGVVERADLPGSLESRLTSKRPAWAQGMAATGREGDQPTTPPDGRGDQAPDAASRSGSGRWCWPCVPGAFNPRACEVRGRPDGFTGRAGGARVMVIPVC
jgi:hypothetical protein